MASNERILAIDIGATSIKLCEFEYGKGNSMNLALFAHREYEEELSEGTRMNVVSGLLRQMLAEGGFRARKALLSLSGQSALMRFSRLPVVNYDKKSIKQLAEYEKAADQVVATEELLHESLFEQREVGIDTSSFSSALIHALRQDPDIIMVGEMRDRTSFDAALTAADTGHLVLTTLHATNAYLSINRLLDLYSKEEQDSIRESLANNLHSIISQRLLPKAFGGGRVPAWEIMINTPVISKIIRENHLKDLPGAIAGGGQDGMATFNQSLFNLVSDGTITEEDALIASDNPEAMKMNFNGIFLSAEAGGGITG